MYQSKLVAVIKSNSKVLREHGNLVYLPFGTEYSILIKNLNTVRAEVRISIDGEDVLNGNSLVVNANESIELERYLKDLDKGNRFKFIERSESIEQHRGVGVEDGLIRIEYQFEKPYVDLWNRNKHYRTQDPWKTDLWTSPVFCDSGPNTGKTRGVSRTGEYYKDLMNTTTDSTDFTVFASSQATTNSSVSDVGITVPGSISDQKFNIVDPLNLEGETHCIVLQIKGETQTKKVVKLVTVKQKPKCKTCGRVNKATAKFCINCGTSLEVI